MRAIFDAHCDTISEIYNKNMSLYKNAFHLDLERMEKLNTYIQIFAVFIDKKNISASPFNHCMALIRKYHSEIEKNKGRISVIETVEQLEKALKSRGLYSVLSIEGGEALEGSTDAIYMYHKLGVRLITLTWNYANEIADGITESRGGGLTDFGEKAVKIMEDLGILIDVSHISERGFWDVAENTKHPFVASHSCVKALCGHKRNLSDEQIKEIIKRRGCIGVNFYPEFLSDNKMCGIESIVEHIKYIINLGGEDSVGLGSDFDGVDSLPRGISGVQDMPALIDAMIKSGIPGEKIDKISYRNFYRVFYETLIRGKNNIINK